MWIVGEAEEKVARGKGNAGEVERRGVVLHVDGWIGQSKGSTMQGQCWIRTAFRCWQHRAANSCRQSSPSGRLQATYLVP